MFSFLFFLFFINFIFIIIFFFFLFFFLFFHSFIWTDRKVSCPSSVEGFLRDSIAVYGEKKVTWTLRNYELRTSLTRLDSAIVVVESAWFMNAINSNRIIAPSYLVQLSLRIESCRISFFFFGIGHRPPFSRQQLRLTETKESTRNANECHKMTYSFSIWFLCLARQFLMCLSRHDLNTENLPYSNWTTDNHDYYLIGS